ncbi:MAG: PriCT-2 domain-containing protein [Gammaproteobacteria bacterium]
MSTERARAALNHLDPSCERGIWIRIGMAAKSASLSFEDFHNWSKNGGNYSGEKDCRSVWKSFKECGPIKAGTLFSIARENGWDEPQKELCSNLVYRGKLTN